MRKQYLWVPILALVMGAWFVTRTDIASAADLSKYAGTWTGSWEGGGAGKFELTLQGGSDGALTGAAAWGSDQGDFTAKLRNIAFTGNKMTAKYDYPQDDQGEITITATFEASAANGTWSLGPKGQDGSMANGTWKVNKK